MSAPSLPASASSLQEKNSPGFAESLRIFLFPLLTNVWPLLLFVSQKAFVIPGLVLAGFGDKAYRRDLLIAFAICACGLMVYVFQYPNSYDQAHLVGFLLFVFSTPLINNAVRFDSVELRRLLTYLTVFNAVMGFFLLVSDVDLYGLRGLNRVSGKDAVTYRVYFESACLAAVVLPGAFRRRWLNTLALLAASAFLVFVAKSVVVIALLGLNLCLPYILRSSLSVKVVIFLLACTLSTLFYIYLPVLRPDVDLSLQVKQYQLDLIFGALGDNWSGWGWGAVYPQLASDPEQPYQIEMQLPMLLLQLGPVAVAAIIGLTLALFLSATKRPMWGIARYAVYLLIGFNNPWLFVPSWFLTSQLLFRYDDEDY